MKYLDFTLWGADLVEIRFDCDECSRPIISDELQVPLFDTSAENASHNYVTEYAGVSCSQCSKNFEIIINFGFTGGNITINNLVEDATVEVVELPELPNHYYIDADIPNNFDPLYYDAVRSNKKFYETFITELQKLKTLNQTNLLDPALNQTLRGLIYVNAISCLETYLSDAFINIVLGDKYYFRRFIESFKDFAEQKFELSQILRKMDKLEEIAQKAMLSVVYHNLPKVRGMYQDTLDVQFPPISDIHKAILIRHDLVHRNGKTTGGTKITIEYEKVKQLLSLLIQFVDKIEDELDKAIERAMLESQIVEAEDESDIPF